MVNYGRVENPTLDVDNFQVGDFTHLLLDGRTPSFGVVVGFYDLGEERKAVRSVHFETGFGYQVLRNPPSGSIRKATDAESITYLHSLSENFEAEIAKGGLPGAVAARRQHNLGEVLANLNGRGLTPYAAVTQIRGPNTSVFVVQGMYSGRKNSQSDHLEGLVCPGTSGEGEVSRLIMKARPEGFGNIPATFRGASKPLGTKLIAMACYEVPGSAMEMVQNPSRLQYDGNEWVFDEATPPQ